MRHTKPEEDYFSPGFHNFVESITAAKAGGEVRYPKGCFDTRVGKSESVHEWFKRLVDGSLKGRPEAAAMEDRMAVFAHMGVSQDRIHTASIQVLIVAEDLCSFYLDPSEKHWYLRMDYDPACLGELFNHPQPHVHTSPHGTPRFVLPCLPSGNAIGDFFDFVYRNFFHEQWLGWARHAFEKWARNSMDPEAGQQFDVITEAFRAGKHEILCAAFAKQLVGMKAACADIKAGVLPFRVPTQEAGALTYEF